METFSVGHCTGPGKIAMRSQPWKKVHFDARAFLVDVPRHGKLLIDTGYSSEFFKVTKKWPYSLYRHSLPVSFETPLAFQIEKPDYVLITHFHPDHVAGLCDFQDVPWIYRKSALDELTSYHPLKALKHGFFKDLIPGIPPGSIAIGEDFEPLWDFELRHFDVFGDGSLILVDLPGHALGQMGAIVGEHFFVADAVWASEAIEESVLPHALGLAVQHDRGAYIHTFEQIARVNQRTDLEIVPTHTMREV